VWRRVCASEFQAGVTRCLDCGIDLVDDLPSLPPSLLPARRYGAKAVYRGRLSDEPAQVLFDVVRRALAKLRFREGVVDPRRCILVASRNDPPRDEYEVYAWLLLKLRAGWAAKIYQDLAVVITDEGDAGCFLQCEAHSGHIRGATEDELIDELFRMLDKLS
jgi:hypothetical protein